MTTDPAPTPMKADELTEEIGEGFLKLGGSGQGLEALHACPVVKKNRPVFHRAKIDTAHLSRYDGTDFFQWHGRKVDGYFYPFGKILRLTAAGRRALASMEK